MLRKAHNRCGGIPPFNNMDLLAIAQLARVFTKVLIRYVAAHVLCHQPRPVDDLNISLALMALHCTVQAMADKAH